MYIDCSRLIFIWSYFSDFVKNVLISYCESSSEGMGRGKMRDPGMQLFLWSKAMAFPTFILCCGQSLFFINKSGSLVSCKNILDGLSYNINSWTLVYYSSKMAFCIFQVYTVVCATAIIYIDQLALNISRQGHKAIIFFNIRICQFYQKVI